MNNSNLEALIDLLTTALDPRFKDRNDVRELLLDDKILEELLRQLQIFVEMRSQMLSKNPPVFGLIVMDESESAKDAFKDLKQWLKNAESLLIIDPYILHVPSKRTGLFSTADEYCDFISELVDNTVRDLTFVGMGFTTKIKNALNRKLKEGRKIEFIDSATIHDRYLIKNEAQGKILGTSLSGFGNKIFTILDLPPEDVKTIRKVIHKMRTDVRRT